MKNPLTASIVIDNFNYGHFIADAIDSALGQTYQHVEVLVVDDGSTDNSREVIARYGDRLKPVFKQNGGLASALNVGYGASTGDVIFFLDSDDALLPTAVESVIRAWGDTVVHVYFPLEAIDGNGQPLGRTVGGTVAPDRALGPFGVGSPTSGNAFSRNALQRVMPIPEHDCERYGDNYLTATCSLLGEVRRVGETLGRYRVHADSMSSKDLGLAHARRRIRRDLRLHEAMFRLGGEKIGPPEKWLGRYPQHWVGRITSLRESPQDHAWPDTLPGLMRKAVGATWRHPYWNVRRKLAYTTFVIGYGLLPDFARRALKRAEESTQSSFPRLALGSKRDDKEIGGSVTA